MNDNNLTMETNSTVSIKSDEQHIRELFILVFQLLTTVVALFGNSLAVHIILSKKSSHKSTNVTNVLLANLSISDILGASTIILQWFTCSKWFMDIVLPYYLLGERLCSILKALQVLSYYVSTFTMAVIAYDRFKLVKDPLKSRIRMKIWLPLIWLSSCLFAWLLLFSVKLSVYFTDYDNLIDCRVAFKFSGGLSFFFRKYRATALVLTQYLIPLTITGIIYGRISHMIYSKKSVSDSVTKEQLHQMNQKKIKTIRMLVIVVVVFAFCWFPVHLIHLINFHFIPLLPGQCNSSTLYVFCYWLAISSCCYNPFIYYGLDKQFREMATGIFCCCCRKGIKTTRVESTSSTLNSRQKLLNKKITTSFIDIEKCPANNSSTSSST